MLKLTDYPMNWVRDGSAAFGRLCVETVAGGGSSSGAASAAFGRLCVETLTVMRSKEPVIVSRLRAAVC